MSNFSDIKKRLSTSTTLPAGSAGSGAPQWIMGSASEHHHHGDHHHHAHHENNDEECDEDHTNPSGGCGCC